MTDRTELEDEYKIENVNEVVYACPIDHSGSTIAIYGWQVLNSKFPPVIITHDIGENLERYKPLILELNKVGISTYTFNFKVNLHKKRRNSPRFSTFVSELLQVIAWVKHSEGGRKPIVLGRGMGALILLYLTKTHAKFIRAMILSSPMFYLSKKIGPVHKFLIKTLADVLPSVLIPRWLMPSFTNSHLENSTSASRKLPQAQSAFVWDLLLSLEQSTQLLKENSLPTLFICPEKDPTLNYDFLKPLIEKHQNPGLFSLNYIADEDNLPLEVGGATLKYLMKTIVTWIKENIQNESSDDQRLGKRKVPTIITEPISLKNFE